MQAVADSKGSSPSKRLGHHQKFGSNKFAPPKHSPLLNKLLGQELEAKASGLFW
jgi:hypothetical protein